jgi:hypothetical protein
MATYTQFRKGGTGGPIAVGNAPQAVSVGKHVIDLNVILNGTNNVTAQALNTGDAIAVVNFPAGTVLLGLQAIITTTLDTSTTSLVIGDAGSTNRYTTAYTTPYTAGSVITQASTVNPLRFYSTQDSLLLTLTGTYTTASKGAIRFVWWTLDGSADPISTTQA